MFMNKSILMLLAQFSVPKTWMVSSLILGLLSSTSTHAIAIPLTVPLITQASSTATPNTVTQKLVGAWQGTDQLSDASITLIFTTDGKLHIFYPSFSTPSDAIEEAEYQINSTTQPMQLDVVLDGDTTLTIFEFTADGQLRIEGGTIGPGQFRPSAFTPDAILFQPISDPSQLAEIERQLTAKRSATEAKQYLGSMSRAQQAYRLEYPNFATTIEELGIGLNSETENYRYQILPQGDRTQSVIITAQAKNPDLKSYTAAVFVVKIDDYDTTIATICESEQPSSIPPAIPISPKNNESDIQCAPGSQPIE
ncbi:MAG TPA: hypothetical protein DD379_27610 [Cyanobacteria bacterium UBA11162]|nr:hypothetical protein [Cyanobacteria bacterium UBA12227]HAX88103.1 hypothetical protein [Cyanobacteria bacterium UBA11370]HBL15092.1 hypothetical protein [Cyanobacteria bacterium UBA11162]HBY80568.1 hypothetical protein [Cyanobacteria bacterium UBA11148]